MANKKVPQEIEKLSFEQAIDKLTAIVQKIETGQVPLEESLRQYEQGMLLIAHCRQILQQAEKRIEMIGQTVPPASAEISGKQQDDGEEGEEEENQTDKPEITDDTPLF